MILEVKVFGSAEWYEQCLPAFEEFGFTQIVDMGWSDPETDGEFMGFYYDYAKDEPLTLEHFKDFLDEIKSIIMDGEAPFIKFAMVADKRVKNSTGGGRH